MKKLAAVKLGLLIALLLVLCARTFAQQGPTPGEQALGAKLMQEIQSGINCSAELIGAKIELAKAQARIKELEPKKEELKQ